MGKYNSNGKIGLREKSTNKAIAVYPRPIEGTDKEIEDKVMFWYYQQSCAAGEHLHEYFVDNLTEKEIKALQ